MSKKRIYKEAEKSNAVTTTKRFGQRRWLQAAVVAVLALLAVVAFSKPGRITLSQAYNKLLGQGQRNTATPTPLDLEQQARGRHGWNAGLTNSVVTGTVTFYNRNGQSAGQAVAVIYRLYPDRLRVEMTRGVSTEIFGFTGENAWRTGTSNLSAKAARDIRAWLRLCPERLFTSRATTNYRESGRRVERFRAARPWQGQQQLSQPLALEQVEILDDLGLPPDGSRVGDRRRITYYLNRSNYTIESARWLEPDEPTRRVDDNDVALSDVRLDFNDWRTVGGVLLPYEVVKWSGGRVEFRLQITQLLVNQSLPISLFQQS